jgi:DNA repair protein RadA/Sms
VAKPKILFICEKCGGEHLRWQGRCQHCGEWNTLKEVQSSKFKVQSGEKRKAKKISELRTVDFKPSASGIKEFDRVVGGGFIPGGVILLAGAPGVGKSTLLLQVAGKLGRRQPVVYVSGEESDSQIVTRAERLGIASDHLYFLSQTDIDLALSELAETAKLGLIILDSVQAFTTDNVDAASGSPSQVKEVATRLTRFAKERSIPAVMTGHITKSYAIGGPKTLEHLVDAVLFFEGERFSQFRVLRAVKNRFGSTSEVGVFEMKKEGLVEVSDPSVAFLSQRSKAPGSALTVALEGSRPMVLEIQALTSPTSYRHPRRTTQGLAGKRTLLTIASLEKYSGIKLGRVDIFIKSSFGLRVFEPAADLAIALAIASSQLKKPLPKDLCVFGEVGLNGEIKVVAGEEERRKHAKKLGLKSISAKDYPTINELLSVLFAPVSSH